MSDACAEGIQCLYLDLSTSEIEGNVMFYINTFIGDNVVTNIDQSPSLKSALVWIDIVAPEIVYWIPDWCPYFDKSLNYTFIVNVKLETKHTNFTHVLPEIRLANISKTWEIQLVKDYPTYLSVENNTSL